MPNLALRPDPGVPATPVALQDRDVARVGFTTILGPGEPDHADHFHFDIYATALSRQRTRDPAATLTAGRQDWAGHLPSRIARERQRSARSRRSRLSDASSLRACPSLIDRRFRERLWRHRRGIAGGSRLARNPQRRVDGGQVALGVFDLRFMYGYGRFYVIALTTEVCQDVGFGHERITWDIQRVSAD